MIIFQTVRYKNFLSSGDEFVEIPLNQDKTTIITGTNGAGKTTCVDAIIYCLFNKPLRDIKLSELINSVIKKKLLVEVEFKVNGKQYKIVRGQKPAILEIFEDGKQIEQKASSRDIQQKIEKEILRTDYKTFLQVVVLASMKYKNFMDLDAPSRRLVVENMLDLEIIGSMSKLLKERIKEINSENSTLDMDHSKLNSDIDNLNRLIEANKDTSEKQLLQINKDIEVCNSDITLIKKELEKIELELAELENQKPEIDVEKCSQEFKDKQSIKSKIGDIKQNELSCIAISNNKISGNNSKITYYESNDSCSTCGQSIDSSFKDEIVNKLKESNKELKSNIEKHKGHVETADSKLGKVDELLASLTEQANKLKKWESEVKSVMQNKTNCQNRLNREFDQLGRYNSQKEDLSNREAVNTDGYVNEIKTINIQLEELAKLRAEVTKKMEIARLSGDILKDNGIKAKIIKQYLPIINDSINYYLDKLGAHYSFELDEQFNQILKSRYRDSFSYGAFSNGESTRINLAIVLMWRKLAESKNTVHTNLLIMDEVLDGALDRDGINCVLSMFGESKSDIIVISHRHEIIDQFDRHIEVSKIGNFSNYSGLKEEI